MTQRHFNRGDHVSWNSEAGRVRGRIIKVIPTPIRFKGYMVHASKDEPQYEIKSDKTDLSPYTRVRHLGNSPLYPPTPGSV
jgi:hypothetical protein